MLGLPNITLPKTVYETCLVGKHIRKSFQEHLKMRLNESLEVMHSNVCGPFQVPLLVGNKYLVSFVDEFSRMIWIYVIKLSIEVFEVFIRFKANVEILRTGGGGKFTSNMFKQHCQNNGIVHEITAPYTPQHNDLAKRRNQKILNMTKSTIKGKGLPEKFWGGAVSILTYILNRCPTKRLEGKVPVEVWSGVKPSVGHFKVLDHYNFNMCLIKEEQNSRIKVRLWYLPNITPLELANSLIQSGRK